MALAEYGNALNIDTDGSGNPILVDPDSGDTIAVYDRASGEWQITTIEAVTGNFETVDSDSLNTDQSTTGEANTEIGSIPPRPEVTNSPTTVDVSDYPSIQAALNEVPRRLRHEYRIEIPSGDYLGEDLIVPPVYAEGISGSRNGLGNFLRLVPKSAGGTWSVNSLYILSPHGYPGMYINGIETTGVTPYPNESASIAVVGGGWVTFGGITFSDPGATSNETLALMSYGSKVVTGSLDFGSSIFEEGITTKNGGMLTTFGNSTISGHTTADTINNGGTKITINGEVNATSDTKVFDPSRGPIYISDKNRVHGYERIGVGKPTEVTSNRTLDTWYQNDTDFPLQVNVGITGSSSGDRLEIQYDVNTTKDSNATFGPENGSIPSSTYRLTETLIVPARGWYRIRGIWDNVLDHVYEQPLTGQYE